MIIQKSWGQEIVYIDEPEYVMKMLKIGHLKSTSLHYHPKKKETLYILKGSVNIEIKKSPQGCCSMFRFCKEQILTILPGTVHRITGVDEESIIIEVSTQPKDDSVRLI